ncbi:30S ribosomal protein S9 [soil metagenome]
MVLATDPFIWGTGRRKTAVARVRIKDGNGQFIVNGHPVDDYFRVETERKDVRAPLFATDMAGRVDVFVNVAGSGKSAQSGAVLLGLARALAQHRPDVEHSLREGGFLTRDSRKVERKKYGHKKARRSFQFSKR